MATIKSAGGFLQGLWRRATGQHSQDKILKDDLSASRGDSPTVDQEKIQEEDRQRRVMITYQKTGNFLIDVRNLEPPVRDLTSREVHIVYPHDVLMGKFEIPHTVIQSVTNFLSQLKEKPEITLIDGKRPYAYLYPYLDSEKVGEVENSTCEVFKDYGLVLLEDDFEKLLSGPAADKIMELTIMNAEGLSDEELGKIAQFKHLKTLIIKNSYLKTIPASWKELSHLESVTLNNCPELSQGLEYLSHVKDVVLTSCPLLPNR